MSQVNQKELVIPSNSAPGTIRDSTGKCWVLQGLRENTGNLTQIDLDTYDISEQKLCCEECVSDLFNDLVLPDEDVDFELSSEFFIFSSSSSSSSSSEDSLDTLYIA